MTTVNDYPDHVFALLDGALRTLRDDMTARYGRPSGGLRTSHIRLLSLTPPDGMRVTDLAQRVGMTAQALGDFTKVLSERGFVTVERDSGDKRVRIVRPTELGLETVRQWDEAIRALEDVWRERLGPRRWNAMRRVLAEVGSTS